MPGEAAAVLASAVCKLHSATLNPGLREPSELPGGTPVACECCAMQRLCRGVHVKTCAGLQTSVFDIQTCLSCLTSVLLPASEAGKAALISHVKVLGAVQFCSDAFVVAKPRLQRKQGVVVAWADIYV